MLSLCCEKIFVREWLRVVGGLGSVFGLGAVLGFVWLGFEVISW